MSAILAFPEHAFVYVIGDPEGPQKIGMSFNPSKRLVGIQTNNSGNLVIASTTSIPWPLAREVERYSHWLLREHHARGEWFSVSPDEALKAVEQAAQAVSQGDRAPEIRFGGPGRPFLSKTEKTVTTTIRLPEGLLARIKDRVGERGMARFAREAFETKLAEPPPRSTRAPPMRHPHVYERTAPRANPEATPQVARPVEVSRWISRSLPHMIDEARAAGLDRLADALEVARAEAETAVGRPGIVVEG